MTYGECLFLYSWSLVSVWPLRGTGDWVSKVSHIGALWLCDWPPIKLCTLRLGWISPTGNTSHMLSLFLGELSAVYETPLGEDSWEPCAWSPYAPFSFTDFDLHPFAVINITMSTAAFLGPVSLSSESSYLRIGLGTPDKCLYSFSFPSSSSNQLTSFLFLIALPPSPPLHSLIGQTVTSHDGAFFFPHLNPC